MHGTVMEAPTSPRNDSPTLTICNISDEYLLCLPAALKNHICRNNRFGFFVLNLQNWKLWVFLGVKHTQMP